MLPYSLGKDGFQAPPNKRICGVALMQESISLIVSFMVPPNFRLLFQKNKLSLLCFEKVRLIKLTERPEFAPFGSEVW
jgi:hypothetical protein